MLKRVLDARKVAELEKKKSERTTTTILETEIREMRKVFIYVRGCVQKGFTEKSRGKELFVIPGETSKRTVGYDCTEEAQVTSMEPLPFYEMEVPCGGSRMWEIMKQERETVPDPEEEAEEAVVQKKAKRAKKAK